MWQGLTDRSMPAEAFACFAVQVVGMANTVQKYAPHQAVVQHGTPFNERVDREVMRQLRVGE